MKTGFIHRKYGEFEYLVSPLLEEAGVKHCFTTRLGGVSEEEHLASMKIGNTRGDKEENVVATATVVCVSVTI